MSGRDTEFLARWNAEKQEYARWGNFVVHRVCGLIFKKIDPHQAETFVRIPATPRLKDGESLLQKAFYREKGYASPYDEIEDKVGVRFVLLLGSDVRLVGQAIEGDTEAWHAIKSRDHEAEIAAKPYEFEYQSVHFVVRSKAGLHHEGQPIAENLACEVQIRTLLQHAYSEITHDTLYKPAIQTTPAMKRAAAKSMALIEATGDYFDSLNDLIAKQVQPLRELGLRLEGIYSRIVGSAPTAAKSPLNDLVLDRYGHDVNPDDVENWLNQRVFIGQRIAERSSARASFRLPAILILYYAAATATHGTPINCPVPEDDLSLIYSDLGLSLNG
ncbi:RelA/SpoT domain-containing protein [Pararhodobacter sp.]|uniref:GTP pyrophosphokinase n=1 Tax=Pararhodobacter sp. TaxID=2127056 RepID=UPI002AFF53E5|nr:RelA/SpoT domain-containing protein [Pararhodobacter sp.]